jgi:hypothetical protein
MAMVGRVEAKSTAIRVLRIMSFSLIWKPVTEWAPFEDASAGFDRMSSV